MRSLFGKWFALVALVSTVSVGVGCGGRISGDDVDGQNDVPGSPDAQAPGTPDTGSPFFPDVPGPTGEQGNENPTTPPEVVQPGGETGTPPVTRVDGPFWRVTAKNGQLAAFTRTNVDVNGAGELVLAGAGGQVQSSPDFARPHRVGTAVSTVKEVRDGFNLALPHFEAETPQGTWVALGMSARIGDAATGRWTKEYRLAVWAFDEGTLHRRSFGAQGDANGSVDVDQLRLTAKASAYRLHVTFASTNGALPRLKALGAVTTVRGSPPPRTAGDRSVYSADGKAVLPVRPDRQGQYAEGGVVCSPTTTNMLMNYWQEQLGTNGLADGVETTKLRVDDPSYGYGNWTFNMAYAAARSNGRLSAFLTRVSSLAQVEPLIKAGIPVAASVRYDNTAGPAIDNSAVNSVSGHLLLIRGFDGRGDVYVNDPAASTNAGVARLYRRDQFERAWLGHSEGMIYVIHPSDQELPVDPNGAY